jgi:hypothetical protein
MDRKWRLNRGAHETVESPVDFKRKYVDVLDRVEGSAPGSRGAATPDMQRLVDVYALYTVLHIEKREWTLRWSPQHGVYYFITEEASQGEVPVGDDDDDGSGDELAAGGGSEDGGDDDGDDDGDDEDGDDRGDDGEDDGYGEGVKKDTKETVYCAAPVQVDAAGGNSRRQVLVPVSSSNRGTTPRFLHSLCDLGKGVAQQVLLSVVDSNGTATRCCLYDYIQGPLSTAGVEATLV